MKKEWGWIALYAIYVAIIFAMAGFFGSKHRATHEVIQPIVKAVEIQAVQNKAVNKVKKHTAPVLESHEEVIEVPVIEAIEPTSDKDIIVQADKVIVELSKELVSVNQKLDECQAKCYNVCSTTSKEELELMSTNAIEHNKFVGQKLWEKLEAEQNASSR